ncbi:MAG: NAD(P)-dependent glycerol-3-phosphate dehydrogenase [Nitrospirae bacterium]|nr:MAG: NAD(P)-dependent glycerol-3-phosphate dehydrogenase [Nitrospirota bacterium]
MYDISVLGAGSWGTTLSILLSEKGYNVTLWVYERELLKEIEEKRENTIYLPDFKIPDSVYTTNSIIEAVRGKDVIVSVIPTQYVRGVFSELSDFIKGDQIIVSASKGIEKGSLLTVTGVLRSVLKNEPDLAVLSGPSFAKEVAKKYPTAVTIAGYKRDVIEKLQHLFKRHYFRVYAHDDVLGVELGGALKNVIALASGISDGLGFGNNTRAALITRGLAEITRLGVKMGAIEKTFSGLSGVGDLVLTCTGELSRNRTTGIRLGRGETLREIQSSMKMVAEGVETTISAFELSNKMGVETPIIHEVYKVLYENKPPIEAVNYLMTRSCKDEFSR